VGILTWIHLSDLHFRAVGEGSWEANIVLKALLEDLNKLKNEEKLSFGITGTTALPFCF
jgi:hypothetical protein